MTTELPYEGVWDFAPNKTSDTTIIFIHHFGGSKRTLLRHARLVNELGYNCIRFNLRFNMTEAPKKISLAGDFKIGLRHIWADQIQDILNIVNGDKVLFSLSMPGTAAIEAIAKRNAHQILGLICDSGPFLQIMTRTWKLYELVYKIENKLKRALYTALSFSMWGPNFKGEMKGYFEQLPRGFRILSIRGEADRLVPASTINEFFELAEHCNVEVLQLPETDHLEGLKKLSNIYVSRVKNFLESLN